MAPKTSGSCRSGPRRGVVLVTMAASAVVVFGVIGLAIDIGRMFIAKNETQVYCDSGALAAALALDGTPHGINRAQAAVTASVNKWNFGNTAVSNPSVTFATTATGPWNSDPNPAKGYVYARVTATAPVQLYFIPLVVGQSTYNVVSTATAGQVDITSLSRGLAPYTVVSTNTTGPDFGLVVGNSYDLQWPQYNGTRANCGPSNPDRCFNSPPCSGDLPASRTAVVANWGASINGYWGGSSNSAIQAEILDEVQLTPVAVGTNIFPLLSNGNKAAEAGYLDQRANQDADTSDTTLDAYLANSNHNGRRMIPVIIVDPLDPTHTNVLGYGLFLLFSNGTPSNYYVKTTNGNDPYCGVYAGPYNIGSLGPGAGGASGATWVRLVQ